MRTIRLFKVWLLIGLMVLSGGSLSYAQWVDCGVDTCTNDNVGIGTTTPATPLQVNNRITISGGNMGQAGVDGWSGYVTGGDVYVDSHGTKLFFRGGAGENENAAARNIMTFDNSNGNVAIGTENSAGAKLRVFGTLRLDGGFKSDGGNFLGTIWQDDWTFTTGGVANRLVIRSNGNVGIGTTSPSSKLHVAGDAVIDGNIAAKYQDVAEWVPATTSLAPGTVVVIDPEEANRVIPASQAYDTRIAGVVSSQPGIILGEAGEDKVKVAHSGRVKVKADAQFGPISVGDLLVSSGSAGYAMRSVPVDISGVSMHRPGTIVGKALEPLKEGQGEILALLTLQ